MENNNCRIITHLHNIIAGRFFSCNFVIHLKNPLNKLYEFSMQMEINWRRKLFAVAESGCKFWKIVIHFAPAIPALLIGNHVMLPWVYSLKLTSVQYCYIQLSSLYYIYCPHYNRSGLDILDYTSYEFGGICLPYRLWWFSPVELNRYIARIKYYKHSQNHVSYHFTWTRMKLKIDIDLYRNLTIAEENFSIHWSSEIRSTTEIQIHKWVKKFQAFALSRLRSFGFPNGSLETRWFSWALHASGVFLVSNAKWKCFILLGTSIAPQIGGKFLDLSSSSQTIKCCL